jgi:hypothetical protein
MAVSKHDNHNMINGRIGTCPVDSKYIEAYVVFSNLLTWRVFRVVEQAKRATSRCACFLAVAYLAYAFTQKIEDVTSFKSR